MNLNIKKVLTLIQRQIGKEWSKLDFEYSSSKEEVSATANLTLNNHDDDIRVIIKVYPGGGALFRAVFDKVDKTADILNKVNDFNDNDVFFKAYIRQEGYLELMHFFVCFDENQFKFYAGEFLSRLAGLADDEYLQAITRFTHS